MRLPDFGAAVATAVVTRRAFRAAQRELGRSASQIVPSASGTIKDGRGTSPAVMEHLPGRAVIRNVHRATCYRPAHYRGWFEDT